MNKLKKQTAIQRGSKGKVSQAGSKMGTQSSIKKDAKNMPTPKKAGSVKQASMKGKSTGVAPKMTKRLENDPLSKKKATKPAMMKKIFV